MEREALSYLFRDAEGEIWMVECFPDGDALGWIERKEALDEVQEMSVDHVSRRDDILAVKGPVSVVDIIRH
jgi:hypothetical protein